LGGGVVAVAETLAVSMGGCITRTPLIGGCAVGGANPCRRRTGRHPGRGGVVRRSREPRQRHRIAPSLQPAGRLSRYPTRTPSAVSGHALRPAAARPAARSGPLTGPARGLRGRLPSLRWSRCEATPALAYLSPAGRPIPAGYVPRGSGAAAPHGALRAIDASARPRLLAGLRPAPPWRQSMPVLVATQGDTAAPGHRPSTTDMIARAHLSHQLIVLILLVVLFIPLGCLFRIGSPCLSVW
jgi:hypothetical protein